MHDYAVTFASLNCLDYTKLCLTSLLKSGVDAKRIAVVDNASTDGTQDFLRSQHLGAVILNKQNLSCGAAWNQGILAHQAEWTIVMNNDAIVHDGFATRLIDFAIENNLKLVSPARIDGNLDYDFEHLAVYFQNKTNTAIRLGSTNAICMCIHWSLFNQIGFFRADPNLLGFEDGLFYSEIRKHKVQHATTGRVWIHHFGSVTQDHMKMVFGLSSDNVLVKHNDRRLYQQSWIERKLYRHQLKSDHRRWRSRELKAFGMTLHGTRHNNEFVWL
jgi:GT2 family glycosyltransferase